MPERDMLRLFPDATRSGDGWVAHCPAHGDGRASLSIGRGDDGRWLLKCHAGCDLDAILRAVGLETRDLFPESANGGRAKPTTETIYDYRDEASELLFQVVRWTGKSFMQRRPNGSGGYSYSVRGVRRVLYRLPELQTCERLTIVEGEKDADRLWSVGVPATTNAGGAGKWRPEHTEQLIAAGVRRITILPDNDPAGASHAETVARSCHDAGLEVRIIRLPGLPAKGDVSDWLDSGHTADELRTIIEVAPCWPHAPTGADVTTSRTAVVTTIADVVAESIDWFWPHRLARGQLTLLVGDGGVGKSTLALACAATLSRGEQWPDGTRAPRAASVLLSAEDDPATTIRPRLDALGADGRQIHVVRAVKNGQAEEAVRLDRDITIIEDTIRRFSAGLVIIDPIGAYFGTSVDPNKDTHVRSVLAPLAAMAARTGACVVAIMHIGKGTDRSPQHRVLGSVGFVNAARIVLLVGRHPDDEDGPDGRRVLMSIKQNICTPAEPLAFTLDGRGVRWSRERVTSLTADQVLSSRPAARDRDQSGAGELIRQLLADPDMHWPLKAEVALEAARQHGVSERTIRRKADEVGIVIKRTGFGPGGYWAWHRPPTEDTPHLIDAVADGVASMASMADRSDVHADGTTISTIAATPGDVSPMEVKETPSVGSSGLGPRQDRLSWGDV